MKRIKIQRKKQYTTNSGEVKNKYREVAEGVLFDPREGDNKPEGLLFSGRIEFHDSDVEYTISVFEEQPKQQAAPVQTPTQATPQEQAAVLSTLPQDPQDVIFDNF